MDQRLTLQRAAVVRRVDALFRAMSSDFLLREQFVTDPAQILSEYVYSKKLSPEETAPVNHLIYSVMANRGLLRWLRDRSFQPRGREQSSGVFVAEFTRAAVRHGDHNVVEALIRNSSVAARPIAFDGALLSEIVRTTLGFEDGTEHSPGGGGTQQSGTHTTEQSTGRAEARRWLERAADEFRQAFLLRADATEHSPGGGGTQQSGTHTTEHSTGGGGTRGWLERAADEFRQAFLLRADATEHSPGGGGTQQSGTHTTEQSTGRAEARGWLERAAEEAREVFLLRADATEHSPGGGGTQQSGTHVTEHSTGGGGTRGWVLERAAEEARRAYLLQADGTEKSTGTGGTEKSTGTSGTYTTEHSTGGGGTRGWVLAERLAEEEARRAYLLRADGTEMSTGTSGTDMSTGTSGTDMSTGTSGTDMSTGSGTQQSTGTGGGTQSGTQQSTGTGGTQQSTGTGGTDKSTGTSGTYTTEHSTGGGGTRGWTESIFGAGYASVTLQSLAQYAANLQRLGLLDAARQEGGD
jgi:hypothetical protein